MFKSPWVVVVAIVVVGCLLWAAVKAGGRFSRWLHEPIEPDKPRWTYALTPIAAALAPLAAFSALLPSYLNQQQSDRKFMAEAVRSRNDAEWQRARLDTEMWNTQFAETETRFASTNEQTRAIAALQLADLDVSPKPAATGDAPSDANYPHFAPAYVQLAVALPMEQSPGARAALVMALQKLIDFARNKRNREWQYGLANQLADTNRQTKRALTDALAHYAAANNVQARPTLATLAVVAPFTSDEETTMVTLRDVMATDAFQAEKRIETRLRAAMTENARRASDAALLATVRGRAAHLADVREALATALCALEAPPGASAKNDAASVVSNAAATIGSATAPVADALQALPVPLPALPKPPPASDSARTPLRLQLQDCFLAGADLRGAFLSNADLTGANLNGANLAGTNLATANAEAARRLPPSAAKAVFDPERKRMETLRIKYPHFPWPVAKPIQNASGAPPQSATAPNAQKDVGTAGSVAP